MGFRLGCLAGRAVLIEGDGVHDLERASAGRLPADPLGAVEAHRSLHDVAASLGERAADARLADVTLDPPVPWPRQVFGIGLNYGSHADETGAELPAAPMVFAKFPGCLVGPTADIVIASDTTDHEAELVVVIGNRARDVEMGDAWSVVAGLTVGQDVSDRELQLAGARPQFSLGKSHDTYGPTGPAIVSPDLLTDRDDLAITCDIDGERRQGDTTAGMVFTVAELVAYLSSMLTLHPGDLIFTGTPAGVGVATGRYLRAGQTVRTTIEGLGTLVNRVVS